MRITIFITFLLLSLIFLSSCNSTFAQTATPSAKDDLVTSVEDPGAVNIGESLIHPGSPLYFLKALREKIEVLFDSNSEVKAMRQVEFMQRRLREVNSLIKNKRQDLVPQTIEHYKNNLNILESQLEDEDLKVKVGEAVARHIDVLTRLYDSVGDPQAKAAIRSALQRAQDHNEMLIEKLSLIKQQQLIRSIAERQTFACKFLIRESTASALTDTEKEALKTEIAECRESVRMNLKDELQERQKSR